MKKSFPLYTVLVILLASSFSACGIISDIFQAGLWVGILAVVLVIALIIFIISRIRK
jgi:hypothetical protein